MNATTITFALVLGFFCVWALTGGVRRLAMASGMLDHPNERSSHMRPTPRGGGVAIVCVYLVGVVSMASGGLAAGLVTGVSGAGLAVALLGFIDDRFTLPARWRFLGHTLAVIWALWWLGRIPPVPMFGMAMELGVAAPAIAAIYLVWSINLFNFMDGIDGIASVEAITVCLGGALVWWLAGTGSDWVAVLLLASCVAGFLLWNSPPAKIFMGDAGSGFLGLMLAMFSLWCGKDTPHLFWCWMILYGVFMVDATTTLVRRVARGEKGYVAHRCHAYQYAARKHGGHRPVTLAVAAINVAWLLPIALLVALRWLDGVVGVAVAYAPLVWLAYRYKAGDRASQEL